MNYINYLYMAVLSISFIIGSKNYFTLTKIQKSILYFVILSFFTEWIGFYYLYLSDIKKVNTVVYYLFSPLEFFFISTFFAGLIISKIIKKIILILIPIVGVIFLYFGLPSKSDLMANFNLFMISNFLFASYSIIYLKQLLEKEIIFFNEPTFWIVLGILFFETGFFFLSGFIKYIGIQNINLARKLFSLNHILNIIYYSLITYGFICQARLAKRS